MKQFFSLFTMLLATAGVFAGTSDNFNSRPEASLGQLKGYLQNHSWQFTDFDVNRNGWNPGIEGNGAMVSGPGASPTESTGIYSQQLNVNGHIGISFSYRFSSNVSNRRWIIIYLTDGENNISDKLDSIELTGALGNTTYAYNKTFGAGSPGNRVYIQYRGIGGSNPVGIDQLNFDAPTFYSSGRNQAPVAVNDHIEGDNKHNASGQVSSNDYDRDNGSVLVFHLLTNSTDGNVILNDNGYFTFTPNVGFTGSSTTFRYIACDNGNPSLCSTPATVTITFPRQPSSAPVSSIDLDAAYTDKSVKIKWATTFEVNNDRFEVERSTDGINFKTVGTLKGQGSSDTNHDYTFDDDVKRNMVFKNDLYYRLKQVSLDGLTSYSKVMVVRVYQTKSLQSVSVTPNPAVNDIKVDVQLNENSYIITKVVNNAGEEIMRNTTRGNAGANNLTMTGSSQLQTGVYFLEVIINSKEHMMVKLVKS